MSGSVIGILVGMLLGFGAGCALGWNKGWDDALDKIEKIIRGLNDNDKLSAGAIRELIETLKGEEE